MIMITPLAAVFDNPIIVKHVRSRLRAAQLIPGIIVVLCLASLFTWIGFYFNSFYNGTTLGILSSIAFLILVIGGSNQVANAVGSAKESGILDFHRVSPLSPWLVTLGFFLGAPIREYLLSAILIPFMILGASQSTIGISSLLPALVPTLLTAWLMHALSILVALVAKKPKTASVGVIVLMLLLLWGGTATYSTFRGPRMMQSGTEIDPGGTDFFGARLSNNAFLFLYEGAATLFLLIAATRKMRADRAMPYSKAESVACMVTVIVLALGAFWKVGGGIPWVTPTLLYLFVVAGIVLSSTVTPDAGEYAKGVRRALRMGHRRAPFWADSASNAWAVYALAGLVAVGATIAWEAIDRGVLAANPFNFNGAAPAQLGRISYSQTIAVGVFTVAFYGLASQFFQLRFARKGTTYFRLLLFLVWMMPLLLGLAAAVAQAGASSVQLAMGLSPWAGMMLSIPGLWSDGNSADWVRFMALFPSIALAFLFNFLLTNEQRRVDRHLRESSQPRASIDLIAEPRLA